MKFLFKIDQNKNIHIDRTDSDGFVLFVVSFNWTVNDPFDAMATAAAVANVVSGVLLVIRCDNCLLAIKYVSIVSKFIQFDFSFSSWWNETKPLLGNVYGDPFSNWNSSDSSNLCVDSVMWT